MVDNSQRAGLLQFLFKDIHRQRIFIGDCVEILKALPDEHIDICVTSPPRISASKKMAGNKEEREEEHLNWLGVVFTEIRRVLRPDGSIFLNIGATASNQWFAHDVVKKLIDLFVLQNRIMWIRAISIGNAAYGHFKSIDESNVLTQTFEEICHFTKNGKVAIDRLAIGVPYVDKRNLARQKKKVDLRCRGNVWFIPLETEDAEGESSCDLTGIPEKLIEWCIRIAGLNKDTVVCDPFLRSIPTLSVTKRLGVKGIGIEMDRQCCQRHYDQLTRA